MNDLDRSIGKKKRRECSSEKWKKTVNDTPLNSNRHLSDVIKASVRCKEPLSLREQIDLASGMTAC